MEELAVAFLKEVKLETRVVVRTRITNGFTDSVGFLISRTQSQCVIKTKRELVTIMFADVFAAKEVPPPPARRPPKTDS
jgi:class 3 adenylate cyclase